MTKFKEKNKNKETWYSQPFFVFRNKCEMCLRVDLSGFMDSEGMAFLSVYLYIRDLHDITVSYCNWPLRGSFVVELLNQISDTMHHRQNMMITYIPGKYEITDEIFFSFSGWGYQKFISHKALYYNRNFYSRNDSLYFRIIYDDMPTEFYVSHQQNYTLYFNEYLYSSILPVGIASVITDYTIWLTDNEILAGYIFLFSHLIIGTYIIGNFIGGCLWFIAFILLAAIFKIKFPNGEESLFYFYCILINVAIKILLVDLLHMPWGYVWGVI